MRTVTMRMCDSLTRTRRRDTIVDVPTAAEMAAYHARAPLVDLRTFSEIMDNLTNEQREKVFQNLDNYRASRRSRDQLSAADRRGIAEAAEMRSSIAAINKAN